MYYYHDIRRACLLTSRLSYYSNTWISFFLSFLQTQIHTIWKLFSKYNSTVRTWIQIHFFHWNKGLFGVVFKLGISIVLHIYKTDLFFFFQYSSLFLTSCFQFYRVFICLNHSQPILILNFDEEICEVTKNFQID